MRLAIGRGGSEPVGGACSDATDESVAARRGEAAPLARHGRPGDAVPLLRDGARAGRRPARLPRAARRRGGRRARHVPEPGARLRDASSRRRCRASSRFIRANESDIKRETEEARDRRARHDGARRQGARGRRRVPGRHRRADRRAGPARHARRDRRRIATIRPSSGGARAEEAPQSQRDADAQRGCGDGARISAPALCRDDARARRALRRRRQGLRHAAGACWYTLVERCARARTARSATRTASSPRPSTGRSRRAPPLARRKRSASSASRCAARPRPGCPRRRRRPPPPPRAAASLARRSPSPIRGPTAVAMARRTRRARRRCCAAALVHLLLAAPAGACRGEPRRGGGAAACAASSPADPELAATHSAARRKRCSPIRRLQPIFGRREPRRGGDRRQRRDRAAATMR